jgi:hypothetical protein
MHSFRLAKKREHEANWRKLKFGQCQEFVLTLSGIAIGWPRVRERVTRPILGINEVVI